MTDSAVAVATTFSTRFSPEKVGNMLAFIGTVYVKHDRNLYIFIC